MIVGWLWVLAGARRVFALVEQPARSLFFSYPCVTDAFAVTGVSRCHTWLRAFGADTLKPLELMSTLPPHLLARLARTRQQAESRLEDPDARLMRVSRPGWFHAMPAMSPSQAYPHQFADALAELVALSRLA